MYSNLTFSFGGTGERTGGTSDEVVGQAEVTLFEPSTLHHQLAHSIQKVNWLKIPLRFQEMALPSLFNRPTKI